MTACRNKFLIITAMLILVVLLIRYVVVPVAYKAFFNQLDGGDLVIAAKDSHWDEVNELLDSGSDPNSEDSRGRTALMYISNAGSPALVSKMLLKGADATHKDYSWGDPALEYAKNRNNDHDKAEIIKMLIERSKKKRN